MYGSNDRALRVVDENSLTVGQLDHQADTLAIGYQGINAVCGPVRPHLISNYFNPVPMHLVRTDQLGDAGLLSDDFPIISYMLGRIPDTICDIETAITAVAHTAITIREKVFTDQCASPPFCL